MVTTFLTTFSAVLQVLILGTIGFVLVKRHVIKAEGLALLTFLLINIFLPCFSFSNLLVNFRFENFPLWWTLPLWAFGISLYGFLLGVVFIGLGQKTRKRELVALMSLQNSGNIPIILISTLFVPAQQHQLFVYLFLFLIGFDILLWTWGVWLIRRDQEAKLELGRLINPPLIGIFSALILVALGWQSLVPSFVLHPVQLLGQCTMPVAIMVIGGSLAMTPLFHVNWREMLPVLFGKMVLMPLLGLLVLVSIKCDYLIGVLMMMEFCVPSAISLSILGRYYKLENVFINQAIFLGHLVCVVTMPVFLTLYMYLVKG